MSPLLEANLFMSCSTGAHETVRYEPIIPQVLTKNPSVAQPDMLRENQMAPAANKSDSARALAKRILLCLEIRKHHAKPNWANVSAMED